MEYLPSPQARLWLYGEDVSGEESFSSDLCYPHSEPAYLKESMGTSLLDDLTDMQHVAPASPVCRSQIDSCSVLKSLLLDLESDSPAKLISKAPSSCISPGVSTPTALDIAENNTRRLHSATPVTGDKLSCSTRRPVSHLGAITSPTLTVSNVASESEVHSRNPVTSPRTPSLYITPKAKHETFEINDDALMNLILEGSRYINSPRHLTPTPELYTSTPLRKIGNPDPACRAFTLIIPQTPPLAPSRSPESPAKFLSMTCPSKALQQLISGRGDKRVNENIDEISNSILNKLNYEPEYEDCPVDAHGKVLRIPSLTMTLKRDFVSHHGDCITDIIANPMEDFPTEASTTIATQCDAYDPPETVVEEKPLLTTETATQTVDLGPPPEEVPATNYASPQWLARSAGPTTVAPICSGLKSGIASQPSSSYPELKIPSLVATNTCRRDTPPADGMPYAWRRHRAVDGSFECDPHDRRTGRMSYRYDRPRNHNYPMRSGSLDLERPHEFGARHRFEYMSRDEEAPTGCGSPTSTMFRQFREYLRAKGISRKAGKNKFIQTFGRKRSDICMPDERQRHFSMSPPPLV